MSTAWATVAPANSKVPEITAINGAQRMGISCWVETRNTRNIRVDGQRLAQSATQVWFRPLSLAR
jgi:hypothetical protein